MPLPANDSTWPPAPWDAAYKAWREHEVLWIGDAAKIADFYGGGRTAATHEHDGQPHAGGLVGWVSSRFWGQPIPEGEVRTREHVGWASDLCTLSSDLLFADPPKVGFDADQAKLVGDAGTARMDLIANSDEAHAFQHEGGELTAAFGVSALTVRWDKEVADHAWVAPSGADVTIPEFRNGRLVALTLWTEYADGGTVWRHLERHEKGRIVHALFKGDKRTIGKQVPLGSYEPLAYLLGIATKTDDATGAAFLETGIEKLTAAWWLNAPAKAWRRQGDLAEAGRSDLTPTVRNMGDSMDEIYSSWLKDIRLGAARLLIPEAYLDQDNEGGFSFDRGRELVRKVTSPGTADGDLSKSIEKVQFEIRTEDHERAALAWWRRMLGAAGYGELDAETVDVQKTATESNYGQASKRRTRDKKMIYARQALAGAYGAAFAIDGRLFPGKGGRDFDVPDVTFPAESQIDPLQNAQVLSLLKNASLVSTEIGVRMAHLDWDQKQVDEEVARIKAAAPADPTKLGASNPSPEEEAAARQRLGIAGVQDQQQARQAAEQQKGGEPQG
jgi:hypothetical protein